MAIQYPNQLPCGVSASSVCASTDGCPAGVCPDIIIRRYDTKPYFRVNVEDCDGPLDLTGLVLEANMWVMATLKKGIDASATYFALTGNVGFEQIAVGNVIIMDRVRSPEHMLVEGFDEANGLVLVQRGYHGTTPGVWKAGQSMRIFRFMNASAITEMAFTDIEQVDGTTLRDQLTASYFIYEWLPDDTCLPGCFWIEFKLLKMKDGSLFLPGGYWIGPTNEALDGDTFTGTVKSNSSALLLLDPATGRYLLPRNTLWGGAFHIWDDGRPYTGTDHDDGSVFLDSVGIPSDVSMSYDSGISTISIDPDNVLSMPSMATPSVVSVISSAEVGISDSAISFTISSPGCSLGAGVEWVRRFPVQGEGFLVQVIPSFTTEP